MALHEGPELASFAEACFREAFRAHFEPKAMARLCARVFAPPILEGLLRSGVWLAEQDGEWQGYVALGALPCPLPELAIPALELARLYVTADWQGKGVADRLMGRFLAEAGDRGGRSVWLQAFEGNPRALAFYRRWGFIDFGPFELVCEGVLLPHRLLGRSFPNPLSTAETVSPPAPARCSDP
jgi:GNAT superfamily N-acetyltransferase